MITPLLLLVLSSTAGADCRRSYEALEYRQAAEACQAAVEEADATQRLELYRLLALSAGAVGEIDRAIAAFTSLLALDPDFQLDDTASPKLRSILNVARSKGAGGAVTVRSTLEEPPRVGRPLVLAASVADGPARPIVRLRLKAGAATLSATRAESTRFELPPYTGENLQLELAAIDRFGGTLATERRLISIDHTKAFWLSPTLWLGAAIAIGTGGAGLGLYSRFAADRARAEPFADRAGEELAGARASAYGANAAFAVAGALAAGAAVLFFLESPESP